MTDLHTFTVLGKNYWWQQLEDGRLSMQHATWLDA